VPISVEQFIAQMKHRFNIEVFMIGAGK